MDLKNFAPAACEGGRRPISSFPNHRFTFFRFQTRSHKEMGSSNMRQAAIQAIVTTKHKLDRIDFKTTHVADLFGVNVFNEEVQRQRLPKPVLKALQKTIKHGAPLDPAIADAVATAMKD
jgi:hypothetical protein